MAEFEEVEDEWDEVLIDMRRFAVEQAILMRGPSDGLDAILQRAEKIVDYLTNGPA